MKLRDHYDWMVLGDHPGALLSAGLAARLGLSVLVLPVFAGKGLTVAADGRFVDLEPNFQLSLGRVPRFSGLLSECLSRLGILPAELEQIQGGDALPQILTPGYRLHFSADDGALEHELQRELGKERAQRSGLMAALKRAEPDYLSFWLQLPERLTLTPGKKKTRVAAVHPNDVRRKIAKDPSVPALAKWLSASASAHSLASELRAPEFEDLLAGFWFGATAAVSENPRLTALLHSLVLARTGASFTGGMTAYREFLLRLAKRLGAHIPPNAECRRVFVDKGRFSGVQLANRGTVINAGGAVAGCSLSQLGSLVSVSGRNFWKRLKASPAARGWLFTVSFAVEAAAIPPGASSRMVWKEAGAPPMEIEIVNPVPYGGRKATQKVILVRTVLPFTGESLDVGYQRMIASRFLRQLVEVFPFLEKHLSWVYPEFRSGDGAELAEVYGFASLDAIPENLRCLSGEKPRGLGSRSGIEGLFVANGESFPELGSFGGTVAALESVSWLAHRAGLAGPFA